MERIVVGAVPNEVVWRHRGGDGFEHMSWLPVREEIVRCMYCKHFEIDRSDHEYRSGWWCKRWNTDMVYPEGFCAWGERSDGC